MKYVIKIILNYIEIFFLKLARLVGIYPDSSIIPRGNYCYVIDDERNKIEPIDGYWTKQCKYYRNMKGQLNAGCTYVAFIGEDVCLGDQCKICNENMDE